MKSPTPLWGRISALWLLLAPLCAVLFTLTNTLSANDFWWHAAAGRLIDSGGHIPTVNHFSWGLPETAPYVYQNWLAEWLMYKVLEVGGLTWIVIWRSASVGLAFALIAAAAFRRARRLVSAEGVATESAVARCVAISLFLALAMIALNVDARPQTYALPFFAAFVWVLFEIPAWEPHVQRTAGVGLFLMALTAIWGNFHGSFFLVPLALIVATCGEAVYTRLTSPRLKAVFGAALQPHSRRCVALFALLCCLAIAINPLGFGLMAYVARLSTNSTIQKYMYEWQPPSLAEGGSIVFYLSPFFLLLVARIALRRQAALPAETDTPPWLGALGIRPGELLVLMVFFVMGCRNIRSILWYALLLPVLFAPCAAQTFAPMAEKMTSLRRTPPSARWINAAMLLGLASLIMPLLPRAKPHLNWPTAFRARFAPTPRGVFPAGFPKAPEMLLDKETPVAAAAYLRADPPRGRLWNDMGYGSYLMWALPGIKISADPRIELFPNAYWLEYLRLCQGPPDAARTLQKLGVTDVLLDPAAQAGLVRHLRFQKYWREVRTPDTRAVLLRYSPVTAP